MSIVNRLLPADQMQLRSIISGIVDQVEARFLHVSL